MTSTRSATHLAVLFRRASVDSRPKSARFGALSLLNRAQSARETAEVEYVQCVRTLHGRPALIITDVRRARLDVRSPASVDFANKRGWSATTRSEVWIEDGVDVVPACE